MAQRVSIVLEDDIDGGPADETVTFGLDGTSYEIDLTHAHADALRGVLLDYTAKARKVTGRSKRNGRRAAAATGPTAAEVRASTAIL